VVWIPRREALRSLDPLQLRLEAFSRQVADAIPGARYAFISGANHFTHLEAPEPFFTAVGNFLARRGRLRKAPRAVHRPSASNNRRNASW
jgi:hypothetical protein